MGKTSWYKGWKNLEECGKITQWEGNRKNKKIKHFRKKRERMDKIMEVAAVMFIPRTKDSVLMNTIRKEEQSISSMTNYKIKLVERAGDKLQDILTNLDHLMSNHVEKRTAHHV